ncbi:MAG: ABC transporter ATP-binding protein [bacterium]|nr:ABC transporter ATP-binding protein [bacterium]
MKTKRTTPAVSIKDLGIVRSGKPVLSDFSAEIPKGKVVGLIGPSGSGKTTLMRAIVGVQRIKRGTVTVYGRPAGNAWLRRRVGYMAQTLSVYADLTARENLDYFSAMMGARASETKALIADLELEDCADRLVQNLSGGQQARVSLGVALLGAPKLLVLDEPTVELDPVLRRKLWQRFRRLARAGTTLFVSSHAMEEAEHCDHLFLLRGGRLLASDRPAALRRRTGSLTIGEAFLKLVGGNS